MDLLIRVNPCESVAVFLCFLVIPSVARNLLFLVPNWQHVTALL